jgi:hypothetical protein
MTSAPIAAEPSGERVPLANFGGNEVWHSRRYVPGSEEEVLAILARHREERVRAVGSLHSWSDAVVAPGVTLDLQRLCRVTRPGRRHWARARRSRLQRCRRSLDYLDVTAGRTLPTMGVIKRQTIADSSRPAPRLRPAERRSLRHGGAHGGLRCRRRADDVR